MTTITITKTSDDIYKKIEVNGHAGFADYGKDIVCSAISILTINTVNSIDRLTTDKIIESQDEDNGIIAFEFVDTPSHDADLLVRAFELGVTSIFKEYGKKFLNIKFRRV